MEFTKLLGHRILIEKPQRPKSIIELTPEQEAAMDADFLKQWLKLKVFAIGTNVTNLAAGDLVFIDSHALTHAEIIPYEDKHYLVLNEHDVLIVW